MSRRSIATTCPPPSPAPHALRRDLAPAAGRRAEIDNLCTWFEKLVLVVDLDELVGGARAKPFALGTRHIGIVELALEPAPRACVRPCRTSPAP